MLDSYQRYADFIAECDGAACERILDRWRTLLNSWGWPDDVVTCMVHKPDDCIFDGGFMNAYLEAVQFVALVSATYCNTNEAWCDEHDNILEYVFLGIPHFDLVKQPVEA